MFCIKGKFLGIVRTPSTNKQTGEIRERVSVGIESRTPNKFGSTDVETHELGVPPFLASDRKFMESLAALTDKQVFIEVKTRVWEKEKGYELMHDLGRNFEVIKEPGKA